MKKALIFLLFFVLMVIFLIWFLVPEKQVEKPPPMQLKTASGIETRDFQLHDSLMLEVEDLSPDTGYTVRIVREDGTTITESRLSTDAQGRIPEAVLWYDIGVLPCLEPSLPRAALTHLSPVEISDAEIAGKSYSLQIVADGRIVREADFQVAAQLVRPTLYAADARGCPKSGFLIGEEDVWVVGRNFPAGSLIRLWAVPDSSEWQEGDPLQDVTRQYLGELPPVFELQTVETGFKKRLWPKGNTSIGSYDLVAEVVTYPFSTYRPTASAEVQDVVSTLSYSGFVVQRRQGAAEPLEMNLAGIRQSQLTYRDTFLTTENVYVGVDPAVQPNYMGQSADIYIVADKTDAQWTTDPNLVDVTGFVETITVQFVCSNCWATLAWTAPLSVGKYDVVLDFNQDGKYTPGTDLIDSLDPVGFHVSELRAESIHFRYSGSGALTIYDNINSAVVNPPEYVSAAVKVQPAAWVKGGAHSVQVNFKAVPTVSSAKIWAEGGLGGLNSSGAPVTVSFSGGSGKALFSVNNPPAQIGKHLFTWDWKYKDVNGAASPPAAGGTSGTHLLYSTYAVPNAPMATPWLEVLDYATSYAAGETSEAGAVAKIVAGIYNSGMVYDGGGHHTTGMANFDLSAVFNELRTPGFTVYMDCRDCANLFHVYTNALGFNHQFLRIPGPFAFKPILPMGQGTCNPGNWNYHQVGWCGSHVADGSANMNCTTQVTCDQTAVQYINLLTNTPGITPGTTGICAPH